MISVTDRREIGFRATTLHERLALSAAGALPVTDPAVAAPLLQAWQQAFAPADPPAFERRLDWDDLDLDGVARALGATTPPDEPPAWTAWLVTFSEQALALARTRGVARGIADRRSDSGSRSGGASGSGSGEAHRTHANGADISWIDASWEPPFLELWLPVTRATRAALDARLAGRTLSTAVRQALERRWLMEAGEVGALAAHDAWTRFTAAAAATAASADDDAEANPPHPPGGGARRSAPSPRYEAFIESVLGDGMVAFFHAYPVLARQLARLAGSAVDAACELFVRLEQDHAAIADLFADGVDPGPIVSLEPALSDPHDGRRRVAIVGLASGLRLVYKPRDVGLEQAYNAFLRWAVGEGLTPAPRTLAILPRDGYGWVECVAQEACQSEADVREYYRAAGGLLCVAWLLGGRDLHQENVIATRQGPVLIDVEMLLQPTGSRLVEGPARAAQEMPERPRAHGSALDTALLTLVQQTPEGRAIDVGGLRGGSGAARVVRRRVWHDLRSDALAARDEDRPAPPDANRVLLDGVAQSPDAFIDDLTLGFASAYRFLQGQRAALLGADGALASFAGARARVVFRPSDAYATLHRTLAAPRFQQSGAIRSCALDSINRIFNTERIRPLAWPLVEIERDGLEALDVPRFTVRADDTTVEEGADAGPMFAECGLAAARARVRALSLDDLSMQLDLLADALEDSVVSPLRTAPPDEAPPAEAPQPMAPLQPDAFPSSLWVSHAVWIGRELLSRAIESSGGLTWGLSRFRRQVSALAADTPDLYDGPLGAALFFAALHAVTREAEWAEAARATVRPVCDWIAMAAPAKQSEPIGACHGIGSLMFGLHWTGRLLDDEDLLAAAVRASERLSPAGIDADRALDLAGGTAGALVALLALLEGRDDPRLTALAVHCGDRLLATQVECDDGAAWPARDGGVHVGLAHGAAGVALALVRLHARVGKTEYLHAAERAYRFVRGHFSGARRNWAYVPGPHAASPGVPIWLTAWCHGAPGIALSRGATLAQIQDEDAREDLRAALRSTAERRPTQAEHLCCGNMGRAEVLLLLGHRLEAPSLVATAETIAAGALARARRNGHFRLNSGGVEYRVFDPGFFQGLSGIGYQLLRFAAPTALPSILGFETALAGRTVSRQVTHEHA